MVMRIKLIAAVLALALFAAPATSLALCPEGMAGMSPGMHAQMGMPSAHSRLALTASSPCCRVSTAQNAVAPYLPSNRSSATQLSNVERTQVGIPRETTTRATLDSATRTLSPPQQALLCVFLV